MAAQRASESAWPPLASPAHTRLFRASLSPLTCKHLGQLLHQVWARLQQAVVDGSCAGPAAARASAPPASAGEGCPGPTCLVVGRGGAERPGQSAGSAVQHSAREQPGPAPEAPLLCTLQAEQRHQVGVVNVPRLRSRGQPINEQSRPECAAAGYPGLPSARAACHLLSLAWQAVVAQRCIHRQAHSQRWTTLNRRCWLAVCQASKRPRCGFATASHPTQCNARLRGPGRVDTHVVGVGVQTQIFDVPNLHVMVDWQGAGIMSGELGGAVGGAPSHPGQHGHALTLGPMPLHRPIMIVRCARCAADLARAWDTCRRMLGSGKSSPAPA